MKYYKSSRFPKVIGSVGFVSLLACALLAIGIAIWFAVANRNNVNEKGGTNSPDTTPSYNENLPSYDGTQSSYNSSTDNMPEITNPTPNTATDVAGNTESVPYELEDPTIEQEAPTHETRSFILPVEGNIIKDFNDTTLQYSKTYGDMRLHTGIDIACKKGSDIKAVGTGTVVSISESGELGKMVTVDHGDGITVKYCGFDSISVKAQDNLSAGDLLGTAGTVPSECADENHIHIEVILDEKHSSPLKILGFE